MGCLLLGRRWKGGAILVLVGGIGGCGYSPRAEYEAIRATEFAPLEVTHEQRMAVPVVAMTEFGFDRHGVLAAAHGVTDTLRGD